MKVQRSTRAVVHGAILPWLLAVLSIAGAGTLYWTTSAWRIDQAGPVCTLTRSIRLNKVDLVLDDNLDGKVAACNQLASRVGLLPASGSAASRCYTVDRSALDLCGVQHKGLREVADKIIISPLLTAQGAVERREPGVRAWMSQVWQRGLGKVLDSMPEALRPRLYKLFDAGTTSTGGSSVLAKEGNAPTVFNLRRADGTLCLAVAVSASQLATAAHCLQERDAPESSLVEETKADLACFGADPQIPVTCKPAALALNWSKQCKKDPLPRHCYSDIALCTMDSSIMTCGGNDVKSAAHVQAWPGGASARVVSRSRREGKPVVNAVTELNFESPSLPCGKFATATLQEYGVHGHVSFAEGDSGGPVFDGQDGAWTLRAVVVRGSSKATADVVAAGCWWQGP